MSECTLTKHGYTQVIEEDIDFIKRNIPEKLKGHPCVEHIANVLNESVKWLYPDRNPNQATVTGYVARDKFQDRLVLFTKKPYRSDEESLGLWKYHSGSCMCLPETAFKDLKWEDEPVKVEIRVTKVDVQTAPEVDGDPDKERVVTIHGHLEDSNAGPNYDMILVPDETIPWGDADLTYNDNVVIKITKDNER